MTRKIETERYTEFALEASERPKRMYEYYASGTGSFPFDMLRHDSAWPASGFDAAAMDDSTWTKPDRRSGVRSIKLRSYREPTVARWSSFNWSVGTRDLSPKAV
jgi:hypothetical protein